MHHDTTILVTANTTLFSFWHLGYIITPLLNGEYMALSKLLIGFIYGVVLAFIIF